ncbi:MAG: glycoside hydrolase family 25 protein [Flavobacterium sp.]|nr:MAG: glycoside hydrolase family 25 protein [Flavobacterium sp.]
MSAPKKKIPRKPRRKRIAFFSGKISKSLYVVLFLLIVFGVGYYYRNALAYYFSFKTDKTWDNERLHSIRNTQIISSHDGYVAGIDVSEYQGEIDWTVTDSVEGKFPIGFVFIRATYGEDCIDARFKSNWPAVKKTPMIRGAYHYYRPDENSIKQAQNFINNVTLTEGDLPPVLDIEKIPEGQSIDSLKTGIRRWLTKVEKHYKVKPIIYSGEKYYYDFLRDEFKQYTVWIANYNFFVEEIDEGWQFWQFTQNGTAKGIEGDVDIDIFNGDGVALRRIRIKK